LFSELATSSFSHIVAQQILDEEKIVGK